MLIFQESSILKVMWAWLFATLVMLLVMWAFI